MFIRSLHLSPSCLEIQALKTMESMYTGRGTKRKALEKQEFPRTSRSADNIGFKKRYHKNIRIFIVEKPCGNDINKKKHEMVD